MSGKNALLGRLWLDFTQVPSLTRLLLVIKDGHGGFHSEEAEPLVELLLAGHSVEDDLLVAARLTHEIANDLLTQSRALMRWQNGYVANVGAVRSICQCPTSSNKTTVLVYEAPEHAVGKNGQQALRFLVS